MIALSSVKVIALPKAKVIALSKANVIAFLNLNQQCESDRIKKCSIKASSDIVV
jgi:hypothetical protein